MQQYELRVRGITGLTVGDVDSINRQGSVGDGFRRNSRGISDLHGAQRLNRFFSEGRWFGLLVASGLNLIMREEEVMTFFGTELGDQAQPCCP